MKCRQRLFLFLLTWRFTGAAAWSRVENRIWVDGGSGQLRERPLLSAADERAGQRNRPQAAACHLEFMGGGNAGRWTDHVAGLVEAQVEYAAWLDSLPDSLQDSATAEALRAICDQGRPPERI